MRQRLHLLKLEITPRKSSHTAKISLQTVLCN